jgi:hypothetical protein
MNSADFRSATELTESSRIYYLDGMKYQTVEDFTIKTDVCPPEDIVTDLVVLRNDGWLLVNRFWSWDGPSGPTWDTKTNMRAAMVHDALYYLIRQGKLSVSFRHAADKELKKIMLKDGSWKCRAKYYFWAVRHFAASAAKGRRKIYTAP